MQNEKVTKILQLALAAVEQHGDDHVSVGIIDTDEQYEYSVDYHSPNNGYPIYETGISPDEVDEDELAEVLDSHGIARDF